MGRQDKNTGWKTDSCKSHDSGNRKVLSDYSTESADEPKRTHDNSITLDNATTLKRTGDAIISTRTDDETKLTRTDDAETITRTADVTKAISSGTDDGARLLNPHRDDVDNRETPQIPVTESASIYQMEDEFKNRFVGSHSTPRKHRSDDIDPDVKKADHCSNVAASNCLTVQSQAVQVCRKIILLGDYGVGKSHLLETLNKVACPQLCPGRSGIQCTAYRPNESLDLVMTRDGQTTKVKIMSPAGQERFQCLTPSYFRGAHGCLLVFNINQADSFDHIVDWNHHLNQYAHVHSRLLVGVTVPPQSPDQREITTDRAFKLADSLDIQYLETAVNDEQMVLWISKLMVDIVHEQAAPLQRSSDDMITIAPDGLSRSKGRKRGRKLVSCAV